MSTSKSIPYFNFLKGIAIIMVIGIHCVPKYSFNNTSDSIPIIIRQILNCAVPIFLALSAFFMSKKNLSSKDKMLKFWRKYIPKVYIPCIVWSTPILLLSMRYEGGITIYSIMWMLACGYSIYYFIALIIQFYILLPLLQKFNNLNYLLIAGLISFICVYFVKYQLPQLPLLLYGGPFILWIVFYMLGMYLASHKIQLPIIYPIIITIIAIALQYIEGYYIYNLDPNLNALGLKPSSFLYSISVILILLSNNAQKLYKSNFLTKTIEKIGNISFGIYLIHCYFLTYIIPYFSLNSWGSRWLMALMLSIVFIFIAKKVVPRKIATNLLGFRG